MEDECHEIEWQVLSDLCDSPVQLRLGGAPKEGSNDKNGIRTGIANQLTSL